MLWNCTTVLSGSWLFAVAARGRARFPPAGGGPPSLPRRLTRSQAACASFCFSRRKRCVHTWWRLLRVQLRHIRI